MHFSVLVSSLAVSKECEELTPSTNSKHLSIRARLLNGIRVYVNINRIVQIVDAATTLNSQIPIHKEKDTLLMTGFLETRALGVVRKE